MTFFYLSYESPCPASFSLSVSLSLSLPLSLSLSLSLCVCFFFLFYFCMFAYLWKRSNMTLIKKYCCSLFCSINLSLSLSPLSLSLCMYEYVGGGKKNAYDFNPRLFSIRLFISFFYDCRLFRILSLFIKLGNHLYQFSMSQHHFSVKSCFLVWKKHSGFNLMISSRVVSMSWKGWNNWLEKPYVKQNQQDSENGRMILIQGTIYQPLRSDRIWHKVNF